MEIDIPILKAIGFTGSLEVYKDKVRVIQANTGLSQQDLFYGDISSIQIITAYNSGHPAGFIRFRSRDGMKKSDQTGDQPEIVIYFHIEDEPRFARAKQYILQRMEELNDNKVNFGADKS